MTPETYQLENLRKALESTIRQLQVDLTYERRAVDRLAAECAAKDDELRALRLELALLKRVAA